MVNLGDVIDSPTLQPSTITGTRMGTMMGFKHDKKRTTRSRWPQPSVQTLTFAKERLQARKRLNAAIKSTDHDPRDPNEYHNSQEPRKLRDQREGRDQRRVFDSMSKNDLSLMSFQSLTKPIEDRSARRLDGVSQWELNDS